MIGKLRSSCRKGALAPVFGMTVLAFSGCGNSGSTATKPPASTTPMTATVSIGTSPSGSVTTAQTLATTVRVSATGSSPTGSVILSSGSWASFPVELSAGQVSINIPPGLLLPGSDTLTASFTPADPSVVGAASATATVEVTVAGTAPVVGASSVTYPTSGHAFRAVPLPDGNVLVSVTGAPSGVQVFTPSGTGLQASCLNYLRPAFQADGDPALGLTLFPNGSTVAEAVGDDGVIFQNTAELENCISTGAVVSQGPVSSKQGTFDVAVTPDGKYAFVANEYGVASGAATQGNVGVVQLQYDASGSLGANSTLLGQIATGGNAVAGVLLSPDGTRLYVTSEVASDATTAAGSGSILTSTNCVQGAGGPTRNGLLTVIDVAKAEAASSAAAILATVNAGCSPVRAVETSDLSALWITARGDNRVLAFSPGMLELNAGNALLGYADTGGTAPVGLRLFHQGKLLAVANSNRFEDGTGTGSANMTILSVAVPSTASVVQTVSTGVFPREVTLGADDATLYLTNYTSSTLQVVTTAVQ